MDKYNKNNVKWGIEVLLLFLLASMALGASIGCFNYASLAKKVGNPDGLFWFIGIANLVYNAFVIVRRVKEIDEKYTTKYSEKKNLNE